MVSIKIFNILGLIAKRSINTIILIVCHSVEWRYGEGHGTVEEIEKIKESFVLIFKKIPLEQFAFETLREKNSSSQTFRLNKLERF